LSPPTPHQTEEHYNNQCPALRPAINASFIVNAATLKMEVRNENNSSNGVKANFVVETKNSNEKKHSRETQTLRAGCSKAEPKILHRRRLPSRGRMTAKI